MTDRPEDDWYDDGPDDDEDIDEFEDCGMGPDGYCQLAGTEWCDWDCAHSKALDRIAAMKARQEKKP